MRTEKNIRLEKFNDLTAIEFTGRGKDGGLLWNFLCDCGKVKEIRKKHVTSGQVKTCGCLAKRVIRKQPKDITGQKFNKLTAVCFMRRNEKTRSSTWMFKCKCGGLVVRVKSKVMMGKTVDCGCSLRAQRAINATKHGMEETAFYHKWCDIKSRCDNKNTKDYKYYGGKGISYPKKWQDFFDFFEDMYTSYDDFVSDHGPDGVMINRIDKDKDFNKKNCIWTQRKKR